MIFSSIFGKKTKGDDQELQSPEDIFAHKNSSFENDNSLNNYDTSEDFDNEDGELTDTNEPFLDLATMEKDEIEELDKASKNKNQDDYKNTIKIDSLDEKKEPRSIKISRSDFLTDSEDNKIKDDDDDLFLDNTESTEEVLDKNENLSVQVEDKGEISYNIESNEPKHSDDLVENNHSEEYNEKNDVLQDTISLPETSINIEEDPLYENNVQDTYNFETIDMDNSKNNITDLSQPQEVATTEEDLKLNESINNNEIIENEELSKIAEIPEITGVENSDKNEQRINLNDNLYDSNQILDPSNNNLEIDKTDSKEINIDKLFNEKLNSLLSNVNDETATSNSKNIQLNEIKNEDEKYNNNPLELTNISEINNSSIEIDDYLKTKTDSEKIANNDIIQENTSKTTDIDGVGFDEDILSLQENSTISENKEIYDTFTENINENEYIDSSKFEDFGSELMGINEINDISLKDNYNTKQNENNNFELNNKEIEAEDMGIENKGIISGDDSEEDTKLRNKEGSENKNQNIDIPDININELEKINDDFLSEIQAEKAKEVEEEKKKIKLEMGDNEKEEEMELKPLEVDENLTDIIGLCADNIEEYLKSNGKSICTVENKEQKEVQNDKKLEEIKNENNSKNISFNALDGFHINEELWSELELSSETMEKIENRVKIEIKSFFMYNLIPILKDIIK